MACFCQYEASSFASCVVAQRAAPAKDAEVSVVTICWINRLCVLDGTKELLANVPADSLACVSAKMLPSISAYPGTYMVGDESGICWHVASRTVFQFLKKGLYYEKYLLARVA